MDDSTVKLSRYELSRKEPICKVHVKSFSGAKVMTKKDYIKPTLREMTTHIILHVRTNDVPTKKASEQIAENIVNLDIKFKKVCEASISGLQQGMINTRRKQQM